MKKQPVVIFIALAFLLTGCIEYAEKMGFNKDGSGNITLKLGVDESMLSMGESENNGKFDEQKIRNELETSDGIKVTQSKSYSDKGKKWIEISLDFDSFESLSESSKKEKQGGFIGEISLVEEENGNLSFSRKISFGDPKKDNDEENPFEGLFETMFSQYLWEYEIHFPTNILSANTADENIDITNNKVTWSFSLLSLTKGPQVIKATLAKPKTSHQKYRGEGKGRSGKNGKGFGGQMRSQTKGKFGIKNLIDRGGLKYAPNDDEPYTGKVFDFYDNKGLKKLDGNYRKGLMSGKWMYYHENGQKKEKGNYKNGDSSYPDWMTDEYKIKYPPFGGRNGKWAGWYEDGQKEYENTWKDGKVISAKCWDEDGKEMDCPW